MSNNTMTEYTWDEIQKHTTTDSLWIVIDENVYDVTDFQTKHPGKAGPLLHYAGKDATPGFNKVAKHANVDGIQKYMEGLCIGKIRHC